MSPSVGYFQNWPWQASALSKLDPFVQNKFSALYANGVAYWWPPLTTAWY